MYLSLASALYNVNDYFYYYSRYIIIEVAQLRQHKQRINNLRMQLG